MVSLPLSLRVVDDFIHLQWFPSLKSNRRVTSLFSFPVPLGSIPELPAESCKEIKASERQVLSGKYWLSNIKPGMAVLAHCDMKTEGRLLLLLM